MRNRRHRANRILIAICEHHENFDIEKLNESDNDSESE